MLLVTPLLQCSSCRLVNLQPPACADTPHWTLHPCCRGDSHLRNAEQCWHAWLQAEERKALKAEAQLQRDQEVARLISG